MLWKILRLIEPIFFLILIIFLYKVELYSFAFLIALYLLLKLVLSRLIQIENEISKLKKLVEGIEEN
ncbi:unnamed protein product [marine sediment metagenome]|uniref:Uncharacterized protein n=1 Tax=marine sediment metagenome TaxID=412755 RepID=X1A3C9_9ZZZZ